MTLEIFNKFLKCFTVTEEFGYPVYDYRGCGEVIKILYPDFNSMDSLFLGESVLNIQVDFSEEQVHEIILTYNKFKKCKVFI